MKTAYPSNLTAAQYELLRSLIPEPKPGGRPRSVDIQAVINAILYILVEGVRWRSLPSDFPAWPTVYTYFRNWRQDGTWLQIHDRLHAWVRVDQGRHASPSEAAVDSQSVKSAALLNRDIGYDAGKQIKGRKRFLCVDTLGLILRVFVTAASVGERKGAKKVLKKVKEMGPKVNRLTIIWADGGFTGESLMHWVMDTCRWIIQVVLRPKEQKGFVLLRKRWVVERTNGWVMNCRRLVRDYEVLPETSETFIYLALIRIMVRRLA
jgi:transposase